MEKNNWEAHEIDPASDRGRETLRERIGRKIVEFLTYLDDGIGIIEEQDGEIAE